MTKSNPQVAEFVLCEDIREERDGKVSLMGLYRDRITFLDLSNVGWPRPLRHAVYVRVHQLPAEDLNFELKVTYGEASLFSHAGRVEQPPNAPKTEFNVNANLQILVPDFGEIVTRFSLKDTQGALLLKQSRSLHVVSMASGHPDSP